MRMGPVGLRSRSHCTSALGSASSPRICSNIPEAARAIEVHDRREAGPWLQFGKLQAEPSEVEPGSSCGNLARLLEEIKGFLRTEPQVTGP